MCQGGRPRRRCRRRRRQHVCVQAGCGWSGTRQAVSKETDRGFDSTASNHCSCQPNIAVGQCLKLKWAPTSESVGTKWTRLDNSSESNATASRVLTCQCVCVPTPACVRACVRSHARTAVVMVSVLRRKRESKMQSVCHAYIHAHVHTRINDGTHLRALWVEQRDQCTCPSIRPPVRPSVVCAYACVHVCVHACVCVRAALLGRIGAVGIRRTHGSSLCMRTFVHARVVRILICGVWHLSCKECCECCVIKLHLRALCVRACVRACVRGVACVVLKPWCH